MTATPLIFRKLVNNSAPPALLLFGDAVPAQSIALKAYTAAGWVPATLRRWDGTAWVPAPLKTATLSGWV